MPLPLAGKMEDVLRVESLQMTEYVRALVREDLRKRGLLGEVDEETVQSQPSTQAQEVGA